MRVKQAFRLYVDLSFEKGVGWLKETEMGQWLKGEVIEVRKAFLKKGRLEYVFKLEGINSVKRKRQNMRKVK